MPSKGAWFSATLDVPSSRPFNYTGIIPIPPKSPPWVLGPGLQPGLSRDIEPPYSAPVGVA